MAYTSLSGLDYDYYTAYFPELTETEFTALLPKAEKKLGVWTHQRAYNTTDEMWSDTKATAVKDCLCNLINAMYKQKDTPYGIASISNDGYSETYLGTSAAENEIKSIAYEWLSGTGLMGVL